MHVTKLTADLLTCKRKSILNITLVQARNTTKKIEDLFHSTW